MLSSLPLNRDIRFGCQAVLPQSNRSVRGHARRRSLVTEAHFLVGGNVTPT